MAKFKFLGNGKFTGSMYWNCLGHFDLVGKLDKASSRNPVSSETVAGWKDEYWSLNDSNYERERVGRWGGGRGWKYGGENGEESNSDTGNERRANISEEDDESEDEETDDDNSGY